MTRAYVSELIRFNKTARIGILAIIGITALTTSFLIFGDVGGGGEGPGGPGGPPGLGIDLASPAGAVGGLDAAAGIIGVIAVALFALSVARDYEYGTIRNLFVAEPRRLIVYAGKLSALWSLVVVGVIAAALVSAGLTAGFASGQGIDTSAWELGVSLASVAQLAGATLLYGLIGAAIAIATRSAAVAITAGVAYLLILENLIGLAWDQASEWLPAGVLTAIASGGTDAVPLGEAALLGAAYGAAALMVLVVVLVRRDVTD